MASLTGIAGDVVGTFAVAAAEILAALAMNDPPPVQTAALLAPAPITPIADPTSAQTYSEEIIDLAAPLPETTTPASTHNGISTAPESARTPLQATQPVEATVEPSTASINAPAQAETAFVADALRDLASMPEVSRMVCCPHNGNANAACEACATRAAAFGSPPAAVIGPVEPGRKPRRKPRGK